MQERSRPQAVPLRVALHRARFGSPMLARLVALLLAFLLLSPAFAGDWPAAHHDLHRSNITDEQPTFPMNIAWRADAAQPPAPAWPESPRLQGRMDFDYAPVPIIANGLVYLASTSDDTLIAYDAATGQPRWHFIAGGPIRFAPQVDVGRLFFASDDGRVYCLDPATGKLNWSFFTGPVDERLIGNGRMISRWPVRTGVLAVDGCVYAFGGIWPAEGIYGWSLNAATGKPIWCFDEGNWVGGGPGSGKWRPDDGHSGEFSMTGITPQGAMLQDGDCVIVPMANSMPATFNRKTGAMGGWIGNSSGTDSIVAEADMTYRVAEGKGPRTIFGARIPSRGQANRVNIFPAEQVPQFSALAGSGPNHTAGRGKVSFVVQDEKLTARAAYSMVIAGKTMLLGQEGYVAAYPRPADGAKPNENGKEIWRASVDGQAREMAFANGRLYVTTDRGTLYCFGPGAPEWPMLAEPGPSLLMWPEPSAAVAKARVQARGAGVDRGYTLVIGDPDGTAAVALAGYTEGEMRVVVATDDAAAAQALRDKLLGEKLNGRVVNVHIVDRLDHLPFAGFFANAVVVAGQPASIKGPEAQRRFARELYRVLRPCGGVLLAPGLPPAEALALMNAAGAEKGEVRPAAGDAMASIVRGPLPGARDWNSGDVPDQRVKWPLRPIWFGGPPTILTMFTGIGQVSPLCANGRYFLLGDDTLTAIDAYNGAVLWSRTAPTIHPHLRTVDGVQYPIAGSPKNEYPQVMGILRRVLGADADHVYLTLGKSHFRGEAEGCVKLSARTGEQEAMYAPQIAGAVGVVARDKPSEFDVAIDEKHHGKVSLLATHDGIRVTLTAADPVLTPLDAWDLFFDFRPPASRYGLHDKGVHRVVLFPARDASKPTRWAKLEAPGLRGNPGVPAGEPDHAAPLDKASNETHAEYFLPWGEIDKITNEIPGADDAERPLHPASFGFAAVLNSHDGGAGEPIAQGRLFCDAAAPGINNGWANMALVGGPATKPAAKQASTPSVVLGPLSAMPTGWAPAGAGNPPSIDDDVRLSPRIHPLSGEAVPRIYRSGAGGCGRPSFSGTSLFGRTGKLSIGIYDFDDDSGMRFFGGIASNCGPGIKAISINAALGLLIASESRSHCDCVVPIRTTVAFAPAERRLNEDWAIFFDRNADTRVRQAAINLGALGDHRDEAGVLWLNFPRTGSADGFLPLEAASRKVVASGPPVTASLQIPLAIEAWVPGRNVQRINVDHVPIAGTDRPWIYGSHYRGIKKATLALNLLRPLASKAVTSAAEADAVPTPATMPGASQPAADPSRITLDFTKTDVYLRHTPQALRVLARRPTVVDRKGKVIPWVAKTNGKDAPVWDDDSLEVFLSDAAGQKVVHLGLSASGATFDARAEGAGDKAKDEDAKWAGAWTGVASAKEGELALAMEIPWKTLADAGLERATLGINVQMNQADVSMIVPDYPGADGRGDDAKPGPMAEPMASLGPHGRTHCVNFAPLGLGTPPTVAPRTYTVRLHFAELSDIQPGVRVFDVRIQGREALKDLDVAREAGGVRRALVKEFKGISAGESMVIEFAPHEKGKFNPDTTPILSGLEVYEEGFPIARR
ncbi:MAG: PQQ-binding-like beta-propeller repeat protein [Planctomycetota bacterium]|nr:PQQ-binding-like beta-propeller repeat protein [Planctomycetota bacterium]